MKSTDEITAKIKFAQQKIEQAKNEAEIIYNSGALSALKWVIGNFDNPFKKTP